METLVPGLVPSITASAETPQNAVNAKTLTADEMGNRNASWHAADYVSVGAQEWDIPSPGVGQILVKTEACGVCHTDPHAADGDWPLKPTLPFIPSHETIGRVIAAVEKKIKP